MYRRDVMLNFCMDFYEILLKKYPGLYIVPRSAQKLQSSPHRMQIYILIYVQFCRALLQILLFDGATGDNC
jgi:hypothetical protein